MRDYRAQDMAFEIVDMNLEERSRLRRLLADSLLPQTSCPVRKMRRIHPKHQCQPVTRSSLADNFTSCPHLSATFLASAHLNR